MYHTPKLDRWSQCLLIPGRTADDRGFIVGDGVIEGLGGPITPSVSVAAIRNAASKFPSVGLVDADELALAKEHLANTEALLAEANAEIERLQGKLDSIVGLRKEGFVLRRRADSAKIEVSA